MENPLLNDHFNTPFECIPFDKIRPNHYMEALKNAIKEGKQHIEEIKKNKETPNFKNTIEALENSADKLGIVSSTFFNLHSAESNSELQKVAKEFSPLLTEFYNDIVLDPELFSKVKAVNETTNKNELSTEEKTLLEKTYKNFIRNGAQLDEKKKVRLREIDKELGQLSLHFGDNILKDTNDFELLIEKKNDLAGLPEGAVDAAFQAAKEKSYEGKWLFTLDYPSYIPFMTYLENRDLRKKMFMAFGKKGFSGGETDNQSNVKTISKLRHERANLLGYKTHADFVLEERMAQSPAKVYEFLNELLEKSKSPAKEEMMELETFAKKHGGPDKLEKWDYSYWAEKLKKEKYDLDDEVLRPFFKIENVIDGVFKVAGKLYGLTFTKLSNVAVYHPDVTVYEVKNKNGEHQAVFYADFFPRAGKRNGAWMTSFKGQKILNGKDNRPHIAIVCNFTKPSAKRPSLLTFGEVTTLFHEFGHALHGMLANSKYETLSGTSVFWDFVELPSQIMENWAYEKECLDLFASHYETGEKLDPNLIKRIKESLCFHEGRNTLRQISLALLDMSWHGKDPSNISDVENFEKETLKDTEIMPAVEGVNISCSFSHIFSGGYSSGYYSYKWAEVLDADAFELFHEKGIFNKDVANSFRENILSKGGSEHPMELYKKFRGAEPSINPLLKRAGLLK